jgi:lysophospholipase L1-like esterase
MMNWKMQFGCTALLGLTLCGIANAADKSTNAIGPQWIGTWAASPMEMKIDDPVANSTYRNIVHISLGGDTLRVQLTNEFGTDPLNVGAAHLALSAGEGKTQPGTDHSLTFNGRPTVTIPAGAFVLSDPIPLQAAPMADLVISVYLPDQTIASPTCHELGTSTNYIASGDVTAAPSLDSPRTIKSWCFVKGIDVRTSDKNAAAIVTFGDSITDGAAATPDANHRWPDYLAQRLQADKKTANLSIVNEGISGNRLLYDRAGPNAVARLDRDVIAQNGVKYLIILEGINDIGRIPKTGDPESSVTAQDIIFAYTQLITRAHQHGIKVYGATLTPYVGAGYASQRGEEVRQAVNQWIRTGGAFDAVIDFEKATQDPKNPSMFLPAYEHGDHLHPNDAGYKAMSDSIDLKLFHEK